MKATEKTKKQLVNELCTLIGKDFKSIIGVPCRGKYSGKVDYSILFTSGEEFFVSTGMREFKNNVQKFINGIVYFKENKEKIKNAVSKTLDLDKKHFNLGINYRGDHFGWVFVEIEGKRYIETSFNYFAKGLMDWDFSKKRTIDNFYPLDR